ncbi:MAG TPA: glycosyltransferase family 9 protein [Gemmatimonadaceae bacterium]|nr:glycosyltransferase family 9 protein [Gemmatimonadaceae bacterium]
MRRKHFLIVRIGGIGDVVMGSAAARRLRDEYPGARITWLTGSGASPLVGRMADVDDVIVVDERRLLTGGISGASAVLPPLWRRLIRERITHVLMLHLDRRYRVLTAPLLGARVLSLERGVNPLAGRYFGDECARLIDGLVSSGRPIESATGAQHYPLARIRDQHARVPRERPIVALIPGGARNVLREDQLRRWPVTHYAAVAASLADRADVVLLGDKGDDWVRPAFSNSPATDLIGAMSLSDTLDYLRSCALVISHDTGPMHLARLVETPLLAVFGPTDPAERLVADTRTTAIWGGAELACRPCYDGRNFAACSDNACMSSVSVELVVATASRMLAAARPTPSLRSTETFAS